MKARRWAVPVVLAGYCLVLGGEDTRELSLKERRDARKIYLAKCAKCHRFYEPNAYGSTEWKRWMESMSEQSKLKAEQRKLLERFLDEYRRGKLQGKPQDKP